MRNLQNRKFCISCSPYGAHNTKKGDPSGKVKTQNKYKTWSTDKKQKHIQYVLARGKKRKSELIKQFGGKCKYCGYSRCERALTFHHLNRSEKLFGLSINNLWSKSLEAVNAESRKCELVCIRCHMEIEDGLLG
jgi:hypothetical protein